MNAAKSQPSRARDGVETPPAEPAAALPAAFVARLPQIFGPHTSADVLQAYAAPRAVSFRLHPFGGPPAQTRQQLRALGLDMHPYAWIDHGYWVAPEDRESLTHSPPADRARSTSKIPPAGWP